MAGGSKRTKTQVSAKIFIDMPMNEEKLDGYLKDYKNEAKTAAYLGYTNLADFRKFQFSDMVVESFF